MGRVLETILVGWGALQVEGVPHPEKVTPRYQSICVGGVFMQGSHCTHHELLYRQAIAGPVLFGGLVSVSHLQPVTLLMHVAALDVNVDIET